MSQINFIRNPDIKHIPFIYFYLIDQAISKVANFELRLNIPISPSGSVLLKIFQADLKNVFWESALHQNGSNVR